MIIIPSTSIYAKDNPKIIKNNYSGVSATVSTARRTQASDTNVLSVDEVVDNAYMTTYPINFSSLHSEISINVQPKNRKAIALYTMSLNSKEYKKTFYIEKKSGDKDIISIDSSTFTGSVYGRKEIYECDASFDLIRNGAEGSSSVLYEISGEVVFNEGSLLKTEYAVLIHFEFVHFVNYLNILI